MIGPNTMIGDEILVIDQSLAHEAETDTALTIWAERQEIRTPNGRHKGGGEYQSD